MSEPQETRKPNRFRITSIIIAIVMLIGAFGFLIGPFAINVSAAPDTHTWDGGGANALASTKENWVGDVAAPEAGDSALFNAGALPCTWDLAFTLVSFVISTTYTGVVTQGASFEVSTFTIGSGIFTPSGSYTITISGTATITTSSWSQWVGKLILSVDGSSLHLVGGQCRFSTITANGNAMITTADGSACLVAGLTVASGKTLDITGTFLVINNPESGTSISNEGTIDMGAQSMTVKLQDSNCSAKLGTITGTTPLQITSNSGYPSRTCTLAGNAILSIPLNIQSGDATATITLVTSTYSLSATTITLQARGIITQGTGTITCTNYTQNGLSSIFTEGGNIFVGSSGFFISAGIFTGGYPTYILTCSGNFVTTNGNVTPGTLCLRMTGTNKSINPVQETLEVAGVQFSGNTTVDNLVSIDQNSGYLLVDSGITVSITLGKLLCYQIHTLSSSFENNGIISGLGAMRFYFFDVNKTLTFGIINSPVVIMPSNLNLTITLGGNTVFGSILEIYSPLDVSANNYSLSATDIVIGSGGLLEARGATITCSDSWDSSAGTFSAGTSNVILNGTTNLMTTSNGDAFDTLTINGRTIYYTNFTVDDLIITTNGALAPSSSGAIIDYSGNPVIASPGVWHKDPSLLYYGGYYYVAYSYAAIGYGNWSIRMASSTDFLDWIDMGIVLIANETWEGLELEAGGVCAPFLYYEAGIFYMFYQGQGGSWAIGLATTTDINDTESWVKYSGNPIITGVGAPAYDPAVLKVGTGYYMYYKSGIGVVPGIFLATSANLYSWANYPSNPIYSDGNDQEGPSNVVELPDGLYMMYITNSNLSDCQVLERLYSNDLINWFDGGSFYVTEQLSGWHNGGSNSIIKQGNTILMIYQLDTPTSYDLYVAHCELNPVVIKVIDIAQIRLSGITISMTPADFTSIAPESGPSTCQWVLNSTGPNIIFTLSGLESGRMYRVYIDGVSSNLLTASGSGVISFTYSGPWSEHQFEIVATSITGSISPLVNLIFIMFAIGVVVGVIAEGTYSIRKNKMLSTPEMMRMLFNMLIYIVIGIASLGVLYSIVV
jgi:hypothetical protein